MLCRSGFLSNAGQRLGKLAKIGITFATSFFNFFKDRPDGIDQREQGTGDAIAQFNRAISQLSQEVLAAVGNRAKLCKTKKSAGALDRMNCAKDARKPLGVAWIFLERH